MWIPIYIEVKILDDTNRWREDPRPLAAPCWGGDCLSNLSILPSPGVHLSKSVHMDTKGGKVRTGPGLSLQGGKDTQRYWLQVPSDTDCTMGLVLDINQWKIRIKHYKNFLSVMFWKLSIPQHLLSQEIVVAQTIGNFFFKSQLLLSAMLCGDWMKKWTHFEAPAISRGTYKQWCMLPA